MDLLLSLFVFSIYVKYLMLRLTIQAILDTSVILLGACCPIALCISLS
jgi:hypothetical protein